MTKLPALAFGVAMILTGCGQAALPTSTAEATAGSGVHAAAPGALGIKSVSIGGDGMLVTAQDGRRFDVFNAMAWPRAIEEDTPAGVRVKEYPIGDPFIADMLASLRQLHDGPGIDMKAVAMAIRSLTVAPIVMDADWSDVVLTGVTRTSARHFDLSLTKHGVALTAAIDRTSGLTFPAGYTHASRGRVEDRELELPALAKVLQNARLGPGASAQLRDEAIAILLKPSSRTPGQDETEPAAR